MEPLTTWTCDTCGDDVENAADGYVVWRLLDRQARKFGDYRIIHQARCDPGSEGGYTHSLQLEMFLGEEGLAMLLSWLSHGPLVGPSDAMPEVHDFDEYVDLVRRLHTPYYEEARGRLGDEDVRDGFYGANTYVPYRPEALRSIAERKVES
jgi:hypothetical protein